METAASYGLSMVERPSNIRPRISRAYSSSHTGEMQRLLQNSPGSSGTSTWWILPRVCMYLYSILVLLLIFIEPSWTSKDAWKYTYLMSGESGKSKKKKKLPTVDVVFRARLGNASREIIACLASAKLSDSNSVAAASTILFVCSLILNGNVLCSAWWPNASAANLMGNVDKLTASTMYSPKNLASVKKPYESSNRRWIMTGR